MKASLRAPKGPRMTRADIAGYRQRLLANEEQIMEEINDALARMEQGGFGRCEACRQKIAKRRQLVLQVDVTHENRTVPCAPWLKAQVAEAIAGEGYRVFELPSGAGHDGMAMVDIADVAMVFVRCRGGISHHPDEHVEVTDAEAGARVLLRLIENFRPLNEK